jgi:alanyl-tRNA synthetase
VEVGTQVAKRLYYDSAALEFTATVTDIRLDSRAGTEQLWQVALNQTAFYPESGGQPWDTGVLVAVARSGVTLEVPVERVEEDEHGEVWHFVRKPLVAGTEVTGIVNAERRSDHEQQHSGQHLLSAIFLREVGALTVSFHLGAESSTIDLALREGAERLSDQELQRVEEATNRVVFESRPLFTHWVERGLAEAMLERGDLRKLPEREGPFRIVQMQGIEFNACGGTHVANTGAIGSVLLRRVEKVRQGWRVELVCGLRAVRTARRDFEMLGATAQSLSIGAVDVPARVATLLDEAKAAAKQRRNILDELARAEAVALFSEAAVGAVIRSTFAGRDVEFAKKVASKVAGFGSAAVIGVTNGAEGAIAMAATTVNCGVVLREVLIAVGARGGGSAEMAQGVCHAEQVEELLEELVQRLSGQTIKAGTFL